MVCLTASWSFAHITESDRSPTYFWEPSGPQILALERSQSTDNVPPLIPETRCRYLARDSDRGLHYSGRRSGQKRSTLRSAGTTIDLVLTYSPCTAVDAERSANELPAVQESQTHVYITLGCLAALTALSWCLSYLTTKDSWWNVTGRCMVFAPAGALLRYWFSLYNKNCGSVKFFTMIPNVLASAIDAAIFSAYLPNEYVLISATNNWWADFSTGHYASLSVSLWLGSVTMPLYQ